MFVPQKKLNLKLKTEAIEPLELAFLFARVFGGLGLPVRRFLRGLQQCLSRPDPVTDGAFTAISSLGVRASGTEGAGCDGMAHVLSIGHVA